jgi:heptosyltransferase-2
MDPGRWKKVLVLQTSFIGDTILTLPLICEIKRRFGAAHLALMCTPAGAELLSGHPAIDEFIIDDKKGADGGWAGLCRQAARLKEKSFSVALTPHKSLRTALLLRLAGIPWRIGFRQSKGWFFFQARASRDPARHDVERNLSVLTACGVRPEDCDRALHLPVSASVLASVREKLQGLGYKPDKAAIGFNPGSIWPMKRWSAQSFGRLIDRVVEAYGCQAILFGGPDDREITSAAENFCHVKPINTAGLLSLGELPAAISLCRVFVTNDSGPMHIAVARDVPTVAIFCATAPSQGFYPYSSKAVVVEKNLHCRPCSAHGGRRCPLGTEDCIRTISAQDVFAAVEELMDDGRLAAPQTYAPHFLTVQ